MSTVMDREVAPEERKIPNYRQQIRRELPDYVFKPDYSNLWWLPVHFLLIGASLFVIINHFNPWTAILCSVVIGHSMGCLGFIAHDISHGGSIKNLFLRDFLTLVGFSTLGISPLLWRKWHNADHHNNTQIRGVDPDHLFTLEDHKNNPVLKWLYKIHPLARNLVIFSSFAYRMSQQQIRMLITYLRDKDTRGSEKISMLLQVAAQLTPWIALTWLAGPHVFAFGYFIPLLITNAMVICYIATNHFLNPLADENDVLATSLTVTLPKGLRWMDAWHQHFGAHVAHHLFPGVSGRYTRLIEDTAARLFPDRYYSMPITQALKLLWDTPWVYESNETLIDPHREIRVKTLGAGMEKQIKK